jgi:hypothetical protein
MMSVKKMSKKSKEGKIDAIYLLPGFLKKKLD